MKTTALKETLFRKLGPGFKWPMPPAKQARALVRGIELLTAKPVSRSAPALRHALPEQPFDSHLLLLSGLYRNSRKLYLKGGGRFDATLVTSPRSLSSPILIEQVVEYSPVEREMIWAACDPVQSKEPDYLFRLRTYVSSLFHEQNHRILWRLLPPPPSWKDQGALRRFSNFAESLVIVTDMALGDELGPRLAPLFYLTGATYDPGTSLRGEGLSRREYRNYLQAALMATYMTLELYSKEGIERTIRALFPKVGKLGARAVRRSGHLDVQFVITTNQTWQERYGKLLSEKLARRGEKPLVLPDDPMKNWEQYLIAENWFERIGL